MDSITQAALGATVGGIVAGRRTSKKILLWGAIAGTLPDLDILYNFFTNDVGQLVSHRGVTHSFIIAPIAAYLFSKLFFRIAPRSGLSSRQWFWLFFWCFTTHILIDWMTVYGTQIFYPLSRYPYALSRLFIIDPFYTIPLIVGLAYFVISKAPVMSRRSVLVATATLTSFYIVAAITFGTYANHRFEEALARQEINYRQMQTYAAPFNILIWRTIVITEDGSLNAWYSLLHPNKAIVFNRTDVHPERTKLDTFLASNTDLAKLKRFSKGFYRYVEVAEGIQWIDLRFSAGGMYPFRYLVAKRDATGELQPLPTARRVEVKRRPSIKVIFDELYKHI
ncbi:MAG: metal-dependent hydrolase [Chromatiales bacterium]|nr:metal-dependent hydrolase [Chromatiales bacterium]